MFLQSTLLSLALVQTPVVEAPFLASARPSTPGEIELRIDLEAVARGGNAPIWAGLPLPDGSVVDLELRRDSWRSVVGAPVVDGELRQDLWDGLDLTVWRGTVAGHADSVVRLGVSDAGVNGHLQFDGRTFLLEHRRAPNGEWGGGHFVVRDARNLVAGPFGIDGECGTVESPESAARRQARRVGGGVPGRGEEQPAAGYSTTGAAFQIRIAVAADYHVYAAIGNITTEVAYVYQLLWAVSDFYREDLVGAALAYPYVEFWTTSNDPFSTPDVAEPDKDPVLTEFEGDWGAIFGAQGVHVGMLLTGADIGGGKASDIGGVCDGSSIEGQHNVCGGIVGGQAFPVPNTGEKWEFLVVAHELGHNFGGVHTHSNGIDSCADYDSENDPGDTSMCQMGTIMSYCHICPGGTGNTLLDLHPQTEADMLAELGSGCHAIQCAGAVFASQGLGLPGIPNGSSAYPYHSVLEAARLATLCGQSPAIVYLEGGFPGPVELNEISISQVQVELRSWPSSSGATVGQ